MVSKLLFLKHIEYILGLGKIQVCLGQVHFIQTDIVAWTIDLIQLQC